MPSSKRYNLFVVVAICGAGLLAAAAAIVRQKAEAKQAPIESSSGGDTAATSVRVDTAQRRVIPLEAVFHGFLKPFIELTIASQLSGEITDQWVDVSSVVKKGQPLYRIDEKARVLEHQQAEASRDRAMNEAALAKANWDRVNDLAENNSTSFERLEAHRKFLAAQAEHNRARAAVEQAALSVERSTVLSPIDGVISRVHHRRGEFMLSGQPLVDVVQVERLKLLAQLDDHEVVWVQPGHEIWLTTSVFPGERFAGKVFSIPPRAVAGTHKFEVEVEVPSRGGKLRSGFFVRGVITKGGSADEAVGVLTIPREAVVEQYGQHFCYRVSATSSGGDDTCRASRTAVTVRPIPSDPRNYRVVDGLSEGDRVVTKGIEHLPDSSLVRVTD